MSNAPIDILKGYVAADTVQVRSALCNALAADGSPEAADMLLDMAVKDDSDAVNVLAAHNLAELSRDQLHAIQPTVTAQFTSSKGKKQILNWFRIADSVASQTQTTLFHTLGSWWSDLRQSRRLNRRLFWSRHPEHGALARLFNRYIWTSAAIAFVATLVLFWLTVDKPDRDLFALVPVLAVLSILVAGLPMAAVSAPPKIPLRASVCTFGDVVIILGLVALGALLTMAPMGDGYVPIVLFYLAVPLVIVRLVFTSIGRVSHRVIYPIVSCLMAVGTLIVTYSVMLRILDRLRPIWYESGAVMSVFLMITLPISIFLALHHSIRGYRQIGPARGPVARVGSGVVWFGAATIGTVFISILTFATTGIDESEQIRIELPETVLTEMTVKTQPQMDLERFERFASADLMDVLNTARDDLIGQSTTRVLSSGNTRTGIAAIEKLIADIDGVGIQLVDMRIVVDELYSILLQTTLGPDIYDRLDAFLIQLDNTEKEFGPFERTGLDVTSKPILLDRQQAVVFVAPVEGTLEIRVVGTVGGRLTDIILLPGDQRIDRDPSEGTEEYDTELQPGDFIVSADLFGSTANAETDEDELIGHFTSVIETFVITTLGIAMDTALQDASKTSQVEFELEYGWAPRVRQTRALDLRTLQ